MNPRLVEVRAARHAMAARFEVLLYGEREAALRAAAEEALEIIEGFDRLLSLYRPESDLSLINREASSRPVRVDPRVFHLLTKVKTVSAGTGGAFDPSVAPVLFLWGVIGGAWKAPSADEIEEARAKVGMSAVELDPDEGTVRFARPGMWMDLGSVGKGFALECAAQALRESGVNCGLIHGGTSSVCAIGSHPEGGPWRIAINSSLDGSSFPLKPLSWFHAGPMELHGDSSEDATWTVWKTEADFPALQSWPVVLLENAALSISGIRGKHFEHEGKIYGHVLDPRSGCPVQGAAMAVVKGPAAAEADALSTALLVLGKENTARLRAYFPEYGLGVACSSESAMSSR